MGRKGKNKQPRADGDDNSIKGVRSCVSVVAGGSAAHLKTRRGDPRQKEKHRGTCPTPGNIKGVPTIKRILLHL